MRQLLLAATALFGLASPALAGVITIGVLDDGVAVPLVCTGGVNAPISCSGGSLHFASINVAAVGEPQLPGASLASVTIDATANTAGGVHVLDIAVDQTGLNVVTGGADATSTFTVNHLVGGPFGPATLSHQRQWRAVRQSNIFRSPPMPRSARPTRYLGLLPVHRA